MSLHDSNLMFQIMITVILATFGFAVIVGRYAPQIGKGIAMVSVFMYFVMAIIAIWIN